jgi:hypothetical protein
MAKWSSIARHPGRFASPSADDIPSASGILQSSVEVDYDFIDVTGRNYLFPSRSESHMERKYRQIANMVTFSGYRKFEAESTIDFGKQ